MTGPSGDPIIDRAIDELRRLPAVDELAVRRIVTTAAARRESGEADGIAPARRARWLRPSIAAGLAAAAAVVGFMARGALSSSGGSDIDDARTSSGVAAVPVQTIQMASSPSADAAPVPTQFVLRSGAARRVSVVGDFNGWNPGVARMSRSPGGDLWSITLPVAPGRHTYGFMIDDTVFTLDPRAPRSRDPDLGVEGSVIIVGRP